MVSSWLIFLQIMNRHAGRAIFTWRALIVSVSSKGLEALGYEKPVSDDAVYRDLGKGGSYRSGAQRVATEARRRLASSMTRRSISSRVLR